MTDTVKPPDLKRIVLEPGRTGQNWKILKTIERLRFPIGRSRAWTAARLIESSQIFQDALIVPDSDMEQLALQLCIVREQKVDKVEREPGPFKLPDTDAWSDTMTAHKRMLRKVR